MEIKIKEEFKELIPPLTNEEYKQLEDNCLEEGIREKIILWNNYIIDGHNRYKIANQWNLEIETESKMSELKKLERKQVIKAIKKLK